MRRVMLWDLKSAFATLQRESPDLKEVSASVFLQVLEALQGDEAEGSSALEQADSAGAAFPAHPLPSDHSP